MRIAFQMDPIETVNVQGDTSFALALSAQMRGHEIWVYGPEDLSYLSGNIIASAQQVKLQAVDGNHVDFIDKKQLDLRADIDLVMMRQDPPFDMAYITAAHILELLKPDTLVLNDPAWVRSSPEKLFALSYPDIQPSTLISRDMDAIEAFHKAQGDIVIKPLFGKGGEGIFRIKPDDGNLSALLEMFFAYSREPVIAQAFLPDVKHGDKRIFLINGEAIGGINRRPAEGQIRSNLIAGGTAEPTELSSQDLEICEKIGPELKKRDLIFVGIDVIAGKLTEVNVTSPTGITQLKAFSNVDAAALFWDYVEQRLGL